MTTMRIRAAGLAIAAALMTGTFAACGGSASSGIPTVQQAASVMGATDVHPYGPAKGGASAYAHATWQGKTVTIATFATKDLEDGWLGLAGLAAQVVWRGDRFAAIYVSR